MMTSASPLMPSNAMTYSPIPVNTRMYRNTHFATAKNRFRANGFFLRIRTIVAAVSTAAMHTYMMDPHIGAGAGMCMMMMPAARMQETIVPTMHATTGERVVSPAYGGVGVVTMSPTSP